MSSTSTKPPVVPYNGLPKENTAIAVKRALSRAGYMQWADFTEHWGRFAQRACKNFEAEHGLKVTGMYPKATHDALVKTHRVRSMTEWAFDAYSIKLMKDEHVTPEEERIAKILDGVTWSIAHQAIIHYLMARPVHYYDHFPVEHSFWNDCSGMFAQWYKWGGSPDPHGNNYNGWGNTGTLWTNGKPVSSLKDAQLCDAVLYGEPWAGGEHAHVVILREYRNGQWYAGSHGKEAGPVEVLASYRPITGIRRFTI